MNLMVFLDSNFDISLQRSSDDDSRVFLGGQTLICHYNSLVMIFGVILGSNFEKSLEGI